MTSVLNVDTIADKAGTGPVVLTKQHAAKAWIKFDPADSNAIRDSFNFASIIEDGAGEHTLVFSSSMINAEYCVHVTGSTNRTGSVDTDSQTTGQYRSQTDADDSGNRADTNHTFSSVHGDLA